MSPNKLTNTMFQLRWILAPIYMGLGLSLIALGVKFFQETFHLLWNIFSIKEDALILSILTLIDITMVGGLIVVVMLSGFEIFIGKLDLGTNKKLDWLGKHDATSLKAKISASIVAISSIHLLKIFMEAGSIDNAKIGMYIALHITFVLSAYVMGYLDILVKGQEPKNIKQPPSNPKQEATKPATPGKPQPKQSNEPSARSKAQNQPKPQNQRHQASQQNQRNQ